MQLSCVRTPAADLRKTSWIGTTYPRCWLVALRFSANVYILQEHQPTTVLRMPHKAREADSCGSGAEMVSNGGYQTTAHTMGDPVMDVWKIKNWSESGSNDRVDAYSSGYITLWNEGLSFNV